MATKFSDFTAQAATGTTFVVGYDGTTNTRYTQDQLTNFVLDGTLTGNRTVNQDGNHLSWNMGTGSQTFTTSSSSGTWMNFRVGGGQKGALLAVSGGGGMYFRDSGGSDYYSLSQNGLYLNRNAGFGITAQANQRVTIKGAGTTNATTAFLVEDGSGNDIIKALDDRTIGLGYNGVQITNSVSGNESVRINDRSGAPLMKIGVSSGSAAKINICNGYFNTFLYGTVDGMAFTNAGGVNVSQDAASMFTLISTNKGMLPPRMTTAQRDAINSGTFTTGLTLYNTTTNKLQFYNGSAWQDAAGGDNIYTADGTINEDRVITVGHDATTKASYTTTFESNKSTNNTTRNTALGNRLILTETVTSAPTSYSSSRGASISLNHNSTGDDVTGSINVQSINSGSSDYFGRSQMGFRTNTGFVFRQEGTAPSNWNGDALIVRDRAASNQSKSLRYHPSESNGGRLKLVAPNAKTSQIILATDTTNSFYRYISGDNNGALTLGRKLSGASEQAYITMSGVGSYVGNIAVGVNQGTPAATLHVTGSGATSSTTSLIVENSSGDDILNIKDDGTFALGRGATSDSPTNVSIGQSATADGGSISIGNSSLTNASSLQSIALGWACYANASRNINIGILARSAGANSITLATNGSTTTAGNVARQFAVHMSSSSTADFKVIANEGMVPPSITTTVRDAISSPISGSTIYNTTDNKLQFYNGSDWTDAGGGDSIYTADGTISSNRVISFPANVSSITFSYASLGYFYIGSNSISTNGLFRTPVGGRFEIGSYNTRLSANYVQLYSAAYITGTTSGFITIDDSTGTSYNINARLGVIGKSTTSTTDYAFRVQQSDNTDLLTLRDDGAFALGKSASPQGASAVTIGELAETTVSTSIAIGYNSEAAGGIAIGSNADNNQAFSQCIGGNTSNAAQYQTVIGYDADGLSGADRSIAIGASAKAHAQGGIAIGVGANAQNHCIVLGRNVGVSGTPDNSVVFSTRGGNNITYSEADSFTWYNTSNTVPDLKFKPGSDSYWNSSGNFGFGITNPTDRIQVPTSIGIIGDSTNAGKLKLYCEAGTAHHVAIEGPAHTNAGPSYTIKLPNTAPSAGQVLASDANGNLSWKSPHQLDFSNLPTSDPGVEGRLYNDEGTVKVSIP